MEKFRLFTFFSLLFCTVQCQTPPIWSKQFTVNFWQNITENDGKDVWKNTVHYYYDAVQNMSLQIHGKNSNDEYCTKVNGVSSTEACSHLVYNDGYLVFPESNLCCRCCSFSQYCGIIKPGAIYQGISDINGTQSQGWLKYGSEANYFWVTNDKYRKPVRYYEFYKSPAEYTNTWNYDIDSYKETVDTNIFQNYYQKYGCSTKKCDSTFCANVPEN